VKLTYVTTSAQMATIVVVKLLRLRTTNFLLGKDQAARTVAAFFLKKQFS
jgi:hypothetical protein